MASPIHFQAWIRVSHTSVRLGSFSQAYVTSCPVTKESIALTEPSGLSSAWKMYPTARADMRTGTKIIVRANRLILVSASSSSARPRPKRFWKIATSTA